MRIVSIILTLAIAFMALSMPVLAKDDQAKSAKNQRHPVLVVKAMLDKSRDDGSRNTRGVCTLWLKNISDVDVDGIKVNLKLRDGLREIHDLTKEVENLEPGKRIFVNFKWEDFNDRKLTPTLWVTYNGAEGPVTFQAQSPVW